MKLITDLDFIAAQAAINHDDNDAFRYYVEDDDLTDAELDQLVEEIAAPIIATIDCTQCGNCCRSLNVYLTPDDAKPLSDGLQIPVSAIQEQYIEHDRAAEVEEWGMFRHQPCVFLKGNLCSIYAHRPQSCRDYPEFTPDFRWQLGHILAGSGLCPIIYNVIEALKIRLKWYNEEPDTP